MPLPQSYSSPTPNGFATRNSQELWAFSAYRVHILGLLCWVLLGSTVQYPNGSMIFHMLFAFRVVGKRASAKW